MRRFWSYLPIFAVLLLGALLAQPAHAVYTNWVVTGDREWRIGTDVMSPNNQSTWYAAGVYAQVPHKGAYRNEVRRLGSTWATRRYSVLGELQRLQAKTYDWHYYSDVTYTVYQPQYTSSTQSYYWFYNPNGNPYYSLVPVSPYWNQCEARMTSYDYQTGSQRGPVIETHSYRVLQSGG